MSSLRIPLVMLVVGSVAFLSADRVAFAGDGDMKSEVKGVVNDLLAAYSARDIDAAMGAFSHRDDVMVYGTGADEKRVGRAQIQAQFQRDWAQSDAVEITVDWMHVSGSGNIAWAAIDGAVHAKAEDGEMTIPVRITMVLEKEKGSWKIVQGHFSMPALTQEEGESF